MRDDEYLQQLRENNPGRARRLSTVADLLGVLKKQRFFKAPTRLQRAQRAWEEIVGEDIASVSQVRSHTHGEMKVTVSSQALVHELGSFRHDELVEKLNATLESKDRVARISVRSGRLNKR